jgi:site-specific DNA-methyltransferase (adenine-specific)
MAKEWTGFKTGLKPLNEPIIIAQKETDGSIAENIKKWGVGAMNVDDARIPYRDDKDKAANTKGLKRFATQQGSKMIATRAGMSKDTIPLKGNLDGNEKGRFPANVIETDPILGDYDKFFLVSKPEVSEKTHDGLVKNEHPTVKPLNLMAHLVKLVTRPGDIVLDPFAGSGTTLVAAKCAGRNFVGMDIDPGSVGIAKKRIKASCEAK